MVAAGSAWMVLSLACYILAACSLSPSIPTLATYICVAWLTHRLILTNADVVSHDLIFYRALLVRERRPSCPRCRKNRLFAEWCGQGVRFCYPLVRSRVACGIGRG